MQKACTNMNLEFSFPSYKPFLTSENSVESCKKAQPTRSITCNYYILYVVSHLYFGGCHDLKALSKNKRSHTVACNVDCMLASSRNFQLEEYKNLQRKVLFFYIYYMYSNFIHSFNEKDCFGNISLSIRFNCEFINISAINRF